VSGFLQVSKSIPARDDSPGTTTNRPGLAKRPPRARAASWGRQYLDLIKFRRHQWQLGELERARELIDWATQRASEIGHVRSFADALFWKSYLEIWRGDPLATLSAAALERLAREHGMTQYLNEAELHSGWARSRISDPAGGAAQVRRVLGVFVDQGVKVNLGLYNGLLARLEAETLGADSALARLDEAFRFSEQVEHHCSLPFLHRLRGEVLLKRDAGDVTPAEEAFRTAIAIANEQGARSPGLQAALALAKLYQSTGRPAQAHAVLGAALEGFAPTLEMPEIAQAQALLAELAGTNEVKLAIAPHKRRLHLQTAYAQALLWSKGFAAEETRAAFERTGDLATRAELPAERFPALFGQYLSSLLHGDIRAARQIADRFLQEAEAQGRAAEAGVGRRIVGLASTFLGDLASARGNLEAALNTYDRERDSGVREKFALDTGIAARVYLGLASWLAGDLQRANQLIEEAMSLGSDSGHLPDVIHALWYKVYIQCLRNDPQGAAADAENLSRISREHGVELFVMLADLALSWARGRLGDAMSGAKELRRSLADYTSQGNLLWVPTFQGLVAELESRAGEVERALAQIDEGLATADGGGQAYNEPFLHRLRGDLLLKRNPDDPALAEDAYRTAVMLATKQGARTYGLLASLSLAKLYQSTNRPLEAHAILSPALEGFAPTPEMPEIAEGQALMKGLA
jgi:predicted ATPase